MATQNKRKKDKISLLDILSILAKHKLFIFLFTVIAGVYIATVNITSMIFPLGHPLNFMPNVYRPIVKVLVDTSASSKSSTAMLSNSLGNIMLGIGGASQSNSTMIILQEIIAGNRIKDKIGEEFNLYEKFGFANARTKKTLLRQAIGNAFLAEYNAAQAIGSSTIVMTMSYTDTDKEFAAKMLKRLIELIGEEFKNVMLEKVHAKKKFLQECLDVIEQDYNKAQQQLIDFQSQYGPDLKSVAQEQTKYIAQLQAEIYKQELQIRSLYLPENDPQVIQLRDQIRQKKQLINEMKSGFHSFSKAEVPLKEIPDLQRQYTDIEMEAKIQLELYSMMRKELENAKIEEADTIPVFQLLEEIEVPEEKDGPKRGLTCIIFALSAFLISIFISFVIEFFKRMKDHPEEYQKLQNIITMFNIFKRKKS
jgi:tyrosine-protein kinase Etk/Wzc